MTAPATANPTFDGQCGYLTLHPLGAGEHVKRTVEVVPGAVLVDIGADGRLLGVETIGGPVDMKALGEVLRWVTVAHGRG